MTSFIMQGDTKSEEVVNTHGGSWKCLHNKAYSPKHVDWMNDRTTIDFGLYVGNPTDSIRGDLYPWGWETPAYNDSAWLPAKWADVAGGRNTQHAGEFSIQEESCWFQGQCPFEGNGYAFYKHTQYIRACRG
jgi:hypothetical protein